MAYAYTPTTAPTTPYPLYAGWGFFVDLFGQQNMRGPLRLTSGAVWAPSLTFADDNRTGIYQPYPFAIGWAVFGFLRFLVDGDGVTYKNEAGFGSTIDADSITVDRVLTLPDESGTVALKEDDQVTLTNLSGGTVAKGTPVVAVAGGFDVADAGDFAIGLAAESIANGVDGIVQVNGKLQLADWTAIAGTSALTEGELYSTDAAGTVSAGTGSVIFQALDAQEVKILGAGGGGGGGYSDFTPEEFEGDGIEDEFTLATARVPESMLVTLNGLVQVRDVHYETDGSAVTLLHMVRDKHKIEVRGASA